MGWRFTMQYEIILKYVEIIIILGAATSCAGISSALVCTISSKQISPVSVQLGSLMAEVKKNVGLFLDVFIHVVFCLPLSFFLFLFGLYLLC